MSPTARKPRTVIQEFAKRLPVAIDETSFTLFVCGPGPSRRSSSVLRRYVSTEIEKRIKGVTVVWGEHKDFLGDVGNITLKRFSNVTKELHFAQNHADLVLIFPDSPGSFVELGIFGMNPGICGRMLIIFDKQHQTGRGFAVEAMGKNAKAQKAIVRFLQYKDRQAALQKIESLVRRHQEVKYSSQSYASR